ncbi:unnamed protein product [Cylicocyclus nassatus]|uniref:Uncharacterized protein n=1 Tax=Cylicocyclus nassatus TaxID=53992 RepID=A0AA36HGX3_CYLNA|nr:unnamed protein product [Cylicocyclus nassatus]
MSFRPIQQRGLIDKAVELRDSQILNIQSYEKIVWRRRFMAVATVITWIAVIVLIAALATPNWAVLDFMNTEYQQVHVQLGVWGEWRTITDVSHKNVEWIPHFPTPPENVARLADADLKHYYRAQAAIGVIALFLLLSTNTLALYTFYHHRYIYKRLTAGLFLLVAMAIVVVIEVLLKSVDEWNTAVAQASQHGDWDYDAVKVTGYSTRLAHTWMNDLVRKTVEWVRSLNISVEPLMLVLAACNAARSIATPELSEHKMMRVYPAPPGLSDKELKKFYNKKMVIWDNNYTYVNLPIACIAGIMYGGYSDYHGRKLPLLIGIASVLVENAMRVLIWSPSVDISLYWLYPTAAITGLMGDFMLTMSCINAYVADKFDNKGILSKRMIVVSIMFSLGSFIASQCTKYILYVVSSTILLIIVEGILLVSVVMIAIFLNNTTPKKRRLSDEENESEEGELPSTNFLEVTKLSFYSLYASLKVFLLSREGHKRLFLYLTFTASFMDQLVFGEEKSLIGTYTRLPPFNWDSQQYADYRSIRPIIQIIGMFFGLFVFKKWLSLRDTFIICLTIATLGLNVVMIGLAYSSWMIYASLAPGSLHGLLNPLSYSFLSCLVEGNETGKAFAVSSIASKLAGFVQTAILQNIYIVTVDWFQGFVWLIMGGICVIATAIYSYVHVVAKRENIGC